MPFFQSWLELIGFLAVILPVTWIAMTRHLDAFVCSATAKLFDLGYVFWNVSDLAAILKKNLNRDIHYLKA